VILLDCTHTAHTRASSGIQRVTRALHATGMRKGLTQTVIRDKRGLCFRKPDPLESALLSEQRDSLDHGDSPEQGWSTRQKLLGWVYRRWPPALHRSLEHYKGAIFPEVFSIGKGPSPADLADRINGPLLAVVHDLIPVQNPSWATPYMRAHFPDYLEAVRTADVVATVSSDAAQALADYWEMGHHIDLPRIVTVEPGSGITRAAPSASADVIACPPRFLCVASFQERKNHLAMLEAAERLWKDGESFQATFAGADDDPAAREILDRLKQLQAAGCPVEWEGQVSDARLTALYESATATLFPSLYEGFGLPVVESMAHGKPCITSTKGGLRDRVAGGGCIVLDPPDGPAIASAMKALLHEPDLLRRLTEEAGRRHLRTWDDYLNDLLNCLEEARAEWSDRRTSN